MHCPRIPPFEKKATSVDFPIAIAFDFMKLNTNNIRIASRLTDALRLLYPESDEPNSLEISIDPSQPSASEILSIPGIFALKSGCMS